MSVSQVRRPGKTRGRLAVQNTMDLNLADLFTKKKEPEATTEETKDEEITLDDGPIQTEPHQRRVSFRSLKKEVSAQLEELDLSDSENNSSSEEGVPGKMSLLQEGDGEDRENDILGIRPTETHIHCGSKSVSRESIKAFVIFLLVLAAGVVFGLVEVEHVSERTHYLSMVQNESLYLPVELHSALLEVSMKLPPITDLKYGLSMDCINIEHPNFDDKCYREITGVLISCRVDGFSNTSYRWESIGQWNITLDSTIKKVQTHLFDFKYINMSDLEEYRIVLSTNHTDSVATTFGANPLPAIARFRVLFGACILCLLYILIIFDFLHQTVAAMLCAFLALSCLALIHAKPSLDEIVGWIDYQTIILLFGMMVMVGIFSRTGFFEWAAVKAYKLSQGNLWYLTILLATFTMVMSAFLDNVTTMLLVAPVTLKLCSVLDLEPHIILLTEIIFSNVGGTGTIVGDPPNIIIANHPKISPQVNFLNFTAHITTCVFFCSIAIWFWLWKFYAKSLIRDPSVRVVASVTAWKKTLASLDEDNPVESEVRTHVLSYISTLEKKIEDLNSGETRIATIAEMEQTYQIKDWPLFISSSLLLIFVIGMFFLHPLIGIELSLAMIALIGSVLHTAIVIIITGKSNAAEILEKVEWGKHKTANRPSEPLSCHED